MNKGHTIKALNKLMIVCEQIVRVGSVELEAISTEAWSLYESHRAIYIKSVLFFLNQLVVMYIVSPYPQ